MAGFVALVTSDSSHPVAESDFQNLLQSTAQFKQMAIPVTKARGKNCLAAKLDASTTLHPGIVCDNETGSWILAAGTVVAITGDNNPATILHNLLRAYLINGKKALESYDGHFAVVIYNGREESLSVVSDPVGLFSIFFGRRDGQILISTSALAIAKHIQSKPDVLAAEHFLRMGRLDANMTLWQDVKRMFAATVFKVIDGRVEENEYWSPTYDVSVSRLSLEDALGQTADLLSRTFSVALQREGKVWADLTGGFDSRVAVMQMAKLNLPFIAYCMGPEDHPDVSISRKISEEMNWEYTNTQLPVQWDPDQYSWFNAALGNGDGYIDLLKLAVVLRGFEERNTAIKTNVMGVGGETWRGYFWQMKNGKIGRTSKVNYDGLLDKIFPPLGPLNVMRYDRTNEVKREMSTFMHQLFSKYAELPNAVQLDRFEIYRDAGHGGAYLSASAGTGRSLAPLSFKALVNFAFSLKIPWKYPRYHVFLRTFLERENKPLANLDTTTGGPAIPIRFTNVYRFWPLWRNMANRAVIIGSKKILGKTVQIWPQSDYSEYPLPTWRTAFHQYAQSQHLLDYDRMCTAGLYKGPEFNAYLKKVGPGAHHGSEFLGRVISIEMALRATGASID